MKALIVDSDNATRMTMFQILNDLGFDVFESEDAEHAKELMKVHPDMNLIMLDCNLSHESGYDYLAELRLEPQHEDKLSIVMVTCENSMGSILSTLAAGANEYIMKPFDKDIVREKLGIIGMLHAEVYDVKEKTCH